MRVYLDHNATTPLLPEARATWLAVADALGGNPSSLHASGRRARAVVDEARERVAAALAVREDEIVFTSGGTEANNLALAGSVAARGGKPGVITSAAEHSSVLATARALEARGHPLTLLGVDRACLPDLERLRTALRAGEPAVVSVMAANNEVGSLPDLEAVAAILAEEGARRPSLHTDAVQALGRIPLRLADGGVDLVSFSAHKVGGPVGVGVLWRRSGVPLAPILFGGEQEGGLRPGTEDACGIAAAAVAIEHAAARTARFARHTSELASFLWKEIRAGVPGARLLGPAIDERRLPNTLCVLFSGSEGKVLVTRLDLEELEVSAGSACASGSVEPSHVLVAMGYGDDDARSALRLSLGRNTSHEECKRVARLMKKLFAVSRAT